MHVLSGIKLDVQHFFFCPHSDIFLFGDQSCSGSAGCNVNLVVGVSSDRRGKRVTSHGATSGHAQRQRVSKEVHKATGSKDKLPFEDLSIRVILRPNNKPSTYLGEAMYGVDYISYTVT